MSERARPTTKETLFHYIAMWSFLLALTLQPASARAVTQEPVVEPEPTITAPLQEDVLTALAEINNWDSSTESAEVRAAASIVCNDAELRNWLDRGFQYVEVACSQTSELATMVATIKEYELELGNPIAVTGVYSTRADTGSTEELFADALERITILSPAASQFSLETTNPEFYQKMTTFFEKTLLFSADGAQVLPDDYFAGKLVSVNNDITPQYFPSPENDSFQSKRLKELQEASRVLYLSTFGHTAVLYSNTSAQVLERKNQRATAFWRPQTLTDSPASIFSWDTDSHGVITTLVMLGGVDTSDTNFLFVFAPQFERVIALMDLWGSSRFTLINSQLAQQTSDLIALAEALETRGQDNVLAMYAVNNATSQVRGGQARPYVWDAATLPAEIRARTYGSYLLLDDIVHILDTPGNEHLSLTVDVPTSADFNDAHSGGAAIVGLPGLTLDVWDSIKCTTAAGTSLATPKLASETWFKIQTGILSPDPAAVTEELLALPQKVDTMADSIRIVPHYDEAQLGIVVQDAQGLFSGWSRQQFDALVASGASVTLQVPQVIEEIESGHFWFYNTFNYERPWDPQFQDLGVEKEVRAKFTWGSFGFITGSLELKIEYLDGRIEVVKTSPDAVRSYLQAHNLVFETYEGVLRFVPIATTYLQHSDIATVANCTDAGLPTNQDVILDPLPTATPVLTDTPTSIPTSTPVPVETHTPTPTPTSTPVTYRVLLPNVQR